MLFFFGVFFVGPLPSTMDTPRSTKLYRRKLAQLIDYGLAFSWCDAISTQKRQVFFAIGFSRPWSAGKIDFLRQDCFRFPLFQPGQNQSKYHTKSPFSWTTLRHLQWNPQKKKTRILISRIKKDWSQIIFPRILWFLHNFPLSWLLRYSERSARELQPKPFKVSRRLTVSGCRHGTSQQLYVTETEGINYRRVSAPRRETVSGRAMTSCESKLWPVSY